MMREGLAKGVMEPMWPGSSLTDTPRGGLPLEVGYTSTTKPLEEEDNTIRTRASSHVIPALCACHSI